MKFPENIVEVSHLLPDFMGFIFYEKSVRNFTENEISISSQIKKTAVFVNEELTKIIQIIDKYGFEYVQLHGGETPEFCTKIKETGVKVIKAFSVDDDFDFNILQDYEQNVDYFLFDTKGKQAGGNGTQFNWNILKNYTLETLYFLSGGIGINDIGKLHLFLQTQAGRKCYAIDVNSRFENMSAHKNIEQIRSFKQQLYDTI